MAYTGALGLPYAPLNHSCSEDITSGCEMKGTAPCERFQIKHLLQPV